MADGNGSNDRANGRIPTTDHYRNESDLMGLGPPPEDLFPSERSFDIDRYDLEVVDRGHLQGQPGAVLLHGQLAALSQ